MRGCLGWLILMPIVVAFWLAVVIASACGKKGNSWRFLGILSSILIGGVFAGFAHLLFSGEDGTTLLQWIGIIAGGLIVLLGIWTALMTPPEKS